MNLSSSSCTPQSSQKTNPEDDFVGISYLLHIIKSFPKNFIASYLNINSLRYKFDAIKDMLNKNSLDLICIAET